MKHRFKLILLIGIIAIASIAINVFLFQRTLSFYKAINLLRLDPLESSLLKDAATDPRSEKRQRLVIFFGDSRIANWRPMLDVPGWTVINRGIKGQTTIQLLLRLQEDVIAYSPDAVVLQAGINDLKTMGLFPAHKNDIVTNCKSNIAEIIEKITAEGIQAVVLTIFPTGEPGFIRSWFWPQETTAAIDQLNTYLTSLGNDSVHVIDTDSVLRRGRYIRSGYKKDMLHLNPKGYERLNDLLRMHLESAIHPPRSVH